MKMYIYVVHVYQTDDDRDCGSDISGAYSTLEKAKRKVDELIKYDYFPNGNSDFTISEDQYYIIAYHSESLNIGIEIHKTDLDDKVTYKNK